MPSEEKMANPHPTATAADVQKWQSQTDPATAAARNIMVRRMDGLYRRSYLNGSSDHAPILQGVRDLTEPLYGLLDRLNQPVMTELIRALPGGGHIIRDMELVMTILEDHGCAN